ncbi:MAG: HAD hydrolase family protein [Longimicrobiales bacterium]
MSPVLLQLPGGAGSFTTLILDFTGTLSEGGTLLPGLDERLRELVSKLRIVVLTADTFGTAREALRDLPVEVEVIRDGRHKAEMASSLGGGEVIAIGNGRNDIPMMKVAGLGIAVVGPEGAAAGLLGCVDVVARDIREALDLIRDPLRLKATLRD